MMGEPRRRPTMTATAVAAGPLQREPAGRAQPRGGPRRQAGLHRRRRRRSPTTSCAAQVNRAGHYLRELGVRREDRVLLVLDDTTVFPIFFLGAMRIGAVPVPVSPLDKHGQLPPLRRGLLRARSRSATRTSSRALREAMAGLDVRFVARDVADPDVLDLDAGLAAQSDELEAVPAHRDDMAFWLYCSGSTGKPKGVVHLQHDIDDHLRVLRRRRCSGSARTTWSSRPPSSSTPTASATGSRSRSGSGRRPCSCRARRGPSGSSRRSRAQPPDRLLLGARRSTARSCATRTPTARSTPCACACRRPRRCRRRPSTAGASASAWRSSTGSARRRCCTSSAPTGPARCVRGTTGFPVPGYELRLTDEAGAVLEGAARRRARGARRLVRGLLLAPAREDEVVACAATGSTPATASSAARTAPTRTWAATTRCSRSAACGRRRRHGERAARPSGGAAPPASSA